MSIFHRMKKAVVGTKQEAGSASLCPEYDAIRVDFEALHDVMLRIRQQLLTYREANSRMWTSATSLSTEFANMLESTPNPTTGTADDHPYTQMAATMKTSHNQLPAERERLETMLNACLFPLKEQLSKYEQLKQRMIDHDKQKDEVVYYQGKVNTLKAAREQSKKVESATEKEKYDRNVKKLMDEEASFHTMDSVLVAELKYAFEHRVAVLGPIMLAFVCAERQMAASYTQAISDVKLVDVNEANTWLAKHEAAMAAKAVQVQTVTTSKTIVTDLNSSASPAVTVTKLEHKSSTAANVPSAVVGSGVAVGAMSTSGVVVSEPHYVDVNGSSSSTGFDVTDLQSPTSSSASNAFDAFDPVFSAPNTATTTAGSTSTASDAPFYSDPFATPSTITTKSHTEVDGVPYTIGSTATHHTPSTTSTTTTTSTSTANANGTTSAFPVESAHSATGTVATSDVLGLSSTVPVMDDMTLEKTRGAEQLHSTHGSLSGDSDKHDNKHDNTHDHKHDKSSVDDASTFGVGEKTDMFASTTDTSKVV